jgi:hypothetical protein
MNLVYGALVIGVSFVVAKYVSLKPYALNKIFILAACLEFVSVSAIGCVFYILNLGFFAKINDQQDAIIRIFGLAVFLSILVGMKAMNHAKQKYQDGLSK